MSTLKEAWLRWDAAWENGLTTARRLELLKGCATPDLVYTNPETRIAGDLDALSKYIEPALEAAGGNLQVKHVKWFENNNRGALQWDMMDLTTNQPRLSGWSYGQFDENGQLVCVADFW